jgi:hypothetical protein
MTSQKNYINKITILFMSKKSAFPVCVSNWWGINQLGMKTTHTLSLSTTSIIGLEPPFLSTCKILFKDIPRVTKRERDDYIQYSFYAPGVFVFFTVSGLFVPKSDGVF